MKIPFDKPHVTERAIRYIRQAISSGKLAGNGDFSARCARWLEEKTGCRKAFLVPSGTAALEMMTILARIGPGDEVIMPSFTFSSTANAVVLRGGVPVFADIRPDTLNLDEAQVEAAVTPRTRAIVPVHYAGVGCEMDPILAIAAKHRLLVLEDAAQGILAAYRGRPLGSIGAMGALSFHETKNVQCGEGGALLVNDPAFVERAEIVCEKGTDRGRFLRGEIDRYTWVDIGSSYLMNEITAAYLLAHLEDAETLLKERLEAWNALYAALKPNEEALSLRVPAIPPHCRHNGHIFHVLFETAEKRDTALDALRKAGIEASFHYIPLHSSRAGQACSKSPAEGLPVTDSAAGRLLRLPVTPGHTDPGKILDVLFSIPGGARGTRRR